MQTSHHKAAGEANWGKVNDSLKLSQGEAIRIGDEANDSLKLIEQPRSRGFDVTADQYSYTASSTGDAFCWRPGAHCVILRPIRDRTARGFGRLTSAPPGQQ